MIIVDSDVIIMFAKAESIELLLNLFDDEVYLTPKIRDEILIPKEYGYEFPERVTAASIYF